MFLGLRTLCFFSPINAKQRNVVSEKMFKMLNFNEQERITGHYDQQRT